MRRALIVGLVVLLAATAGYVVASQYMGGRGEYKGDGKIQVPRPVVQGNGVTLEGHEEDIPRDHEPVKHALSKLLATADDSDRASAIPKGTRLLEVDLKDGVVTANLSTEFNAINEAGDTSESLAYNAFRKALAQFPEVEKMRIQVDGKPFSGEHSGEWTDIPVRDNGERAGSN